MVQTRSQVKNKSGENISTTNVVNKLVGIDKQIQVKTSVYLFCLGFNNNLGSDTARMQRIQENYNIICIPVSEGAIPDEHRPLVVDGNFATERFFRNGTIQSIVTALKMNRKANERVVCLVCLDFFWLENDYYNVRYGGYWLESKSKYRKSKIDHLLDCGSPNGFCIDGIILPTDGGLQNKSNSYMLSAIDEFKSENLDCYSFPKEYNPIWTINIDQYVIDAMQKANKANNTTQTTRYLDPTNPFYLFYSKKPGNLSAIEIEGILKKHMSEKQ